MSQVAAPLPVQRTQLTLLWSLLRAALLIEAFLLAVDVVAPLGGVTQSISPLARAWPWLLAPSRALFGDALVDGSVPGARGWPALALFATLLVGASCAVGWALLLARRAEAQAVADERLPAPAPASPTVRGARATPRSARSVPSASQASRASAVNAQVVAPGQPHWLLWVVLGVTALLGLTLVLSPALPSDDIFSYILYGRISAVHHANPLITTPATFTGDPFLPLVFWRNTRSVYGPAWLLLSGGLSLLAQALGGSLVVYVLLFKLLGLLAHLANTLLIWRILGRLAPRRQLSGTLLYAWNPLCLLEFCASGHNDVVMLTLLLLGVYCLLRAVVAPSAVGSRVALAWEVAALVAFGLSISMKYVPIILLPFFFVAIAGWLVARRVYGAGAATPQALGGASSGRGVVRAVALGVGWRVGVVALTLLVTALPYWAGAQTFGALLYSPPAQQLDNSLLESVSWPLRWLGQGIGLTVGQARTVVETSLKVGALVVFAALWLWSFRYVVTGDLLLSIAAGGSGPQPTPTGEAAEQRRTHQRRRLRRHQAALPSEDGAPEPLSPPVAPTLAQVVSGTLVAWGWVLLWYSLVASGWFWPWYVTWAVAVVALAPWGRLSVATLLLAGSALTLYAFLPLQSSFAYGYRSFLVFGPVWVYLFWSLWRARRSWASAFGLALARPIMALASWVLEHRRPKRKVSRETMPNPGAN